MATIVHQFNPRDGEARTNAAAFVLVQGTNAPVPGLAFDADTDEDIFFRFTATGYVGSPVLRIHWYADSASSGDVVWGCQIACITPNTDSQDIETDALATAQTVTDTHLGTTGQRLHETTITISNTDSLAAGDDVLVRLYRDANAGGDTMTGDAVVTRSAFEYSDT